MRAGRPDPRWSVLSAVGCVALPCVALRFPVILSIENHCSVQQQRKIAQYLKAIFRDKLDLSSVDTGDSKQLPSPQSLRGKILVKVLPAGCGRLLPRAAETQSIRMIIVAEGKGCRFVMCLVPTPLQASSEEACH